MAQASDERFRDEEHLLSAEEKDIYDSNLREESKSRFGTALMVSLIFNVVLMVALAVGWFMSVQSKKDYYIPGEIYSPANTAVEYKTVVFEAGLRQNKTAYQGSSDEVNAKWDELYNFVGVSQIPEHMAKQLPNATTPTAKDPSQYRIELDVFHQLHCLNMMRKVVYPDTFGWNLDQSTEEGLENVWHLEHCYDQLRQSIQCASDLGTIYWEWSEVRQQMFGNLRTTHTCRNFDKIWEWASHHVAQEVLDKYKHVPGAPIYTGPANFEDGAEHDHHQHEAHQHEHTDHGS